MLLARTVAVASAVLTTFCAVVDVSSAAPVTKTVTVSASSSDWVDTGVDVPASGATITATGDATCHAGGASDCPVGDPSGSGATCSSVGAEPNGPGGPDVPYGGLAGRLVASAGQTPRDTNPFAVPNGTKVTGPGHLQLAFNDCGAGPGYSDNAGSFEVKITYDPSTTVSGQVVRADGSPASGVSISAAGPGGGSATTGGDGRYEIKVTADGLYTVTVSAPYCVSGVQPCSRFRKLQLPPSQVVNFIEEDTTKIDVTLSPASPAANGFAGLLAQIAVTRDGKPLASQAIRVQPNTGQAPRAVVCDQGRRVWPQRFGDGSLSIAGFDGTSDSNGLATFDVLVGTQAGGWLLAAGPVGHPRVFDIENVTFSGIPAGDLPFTLPDQIAPTTGRRKFGALDLSQSRIGRPGEDGSRDQDALVEWLTTLRARGALDAEFAPIVGANGEKAVVFYPRNSDPTQLERHFLNGASAGAIQTKVLDLPTAQKINAGRLRADQAVLLPLTNWEQLNGNQPAHSPAAGGFTFFGFPYPQVGAPSGGARSAGQCLGGGSGMAVTVHSPVNLVFRRGKHEFGLDAKGRLQRGIPGSALLRRGGTETYVVPRGKYKVLVAGTGRGNATLDLTTPGRGPGKPQVFNLTGVRRGASGRISFGPKGAGGRMVFRGRRVKAKKGLTVKLGGLPKRLKKGAARALKLVVRDQFGRGVPGAVVALRGAGVDVGGVTAAGGRLSLAAKPSAKGKVRATVRASGYLPLHRTIPAR